MKVHFQKVICMILAVSLSLSVTALASNLPVEYVYTPEPESAIDYDAYWSTQLGSQVGGAIKRVSAGLVFPVGHVTYGRLRNIAQEYNDGGLKNAVVKAVDTGLIQAAIEWLLGRSPQAVVEFDDIHGIYRLRDSISGKWITNQNGDFPYCLLEDIGAGRDDPDSVGAQNIYTQPGTANKFVGVRSADQNSPVIVSYDILSAACVSLNDQGTACSMVKMPINGVKFWLIYQLNSSDGSYYCNSANRPFVANIEPTVTDNKFDYIVNDNSSQDDHSTTITDSQIIDLTNGVLNMITENGDRISYNIDNVTYDFDNRSYTVNAYDYNIVNNNYEFNYYTYNISYTYNNTYITYIGSTAEYQPTEYELYYELPDGRSSADLTAEDISGLSFEFYDCVNYKKSATDTSLRALYHFDGDTDDSSFFSTQGAFTWNSGASITYMDSNAFNGALYLDERAHQFTITLPSSLGTGDFTLQWRYYQNAAKTSEHNENYVSVGGEKLLGWGETGLYAHGTSRVGSLAIGTWQELALVRYGSYIYLYQNGLVVGGLSYTLALKNQIVFNFGASSRAYSMMDELRFVNFPIAKGGASYMPTTVPYDTNSVLILPDGTVPIADEYWKWDRTIPPVYSLDTTTGYLSLPASNCTNGGALYGGWSRSTWVRGQVLVSTSNSVQVADGFSTFSCRNMGSPGSFDLYLNEYARISNRGIAICLDVASGASCSALAYYNDTYTFTLVERSGKRYSLTCTVPKKDSEWWADSETFEWGKFRFARLYCNTLGAFLYLDINPNTSLDIVYIEAVRGSKPNTGHEFVNCLYPADEVKPNTAAVQSDIPINGYTVGGVRPTFPQRGDVWFPVNGSRISGCYIYNGRAWEETNARWYTGKRWIPIYAFDIITLEDMWDIADAPETVPSINSEHGFWNWWQSAWLDFRGWLSSAWGSGGPGGSSGGGGGSVDDSTFEPVQPPGEDPEGSGWSFLDLLVAIKDGAWSITVGTVKAVFGGVSGVITAVGSIGDYYNAYDADNPDGIFGITNYEGADIWD